MKLKVAGRRRLWYALSAVVILAGLVSLTFRGLNTGIDFTGGTELDIMFEKPVTVVQVREKLSAHDMGGATIIKVGGESKEFLIRSKSLPDGEERKDLYSDLEEIAPFEVLGLDEVSPVISSELTRSAFFALIISAVAMVVYITIRFEFKFGVAAVVALLHDAAVTLGLFSLIRAQVDSSFVVAILTILGYSINDTIIIFDRVRENLKYRKKESFADLVDTSISQTLVRSINTSLTTLMVVLALFIFGGPTIRDFSLALLMGIAVGTYSSIFIAAPFWVGWKEREAR